MRNSAENKEQLQKEIAELSAIITEWYQGKTNLAFAMSWYEFRALCARRKRLIRLLDNLDL